MQRQENLSTATRQKYSSNQSSIDSIQVDPVSRWRQATPQGLAVGAKNLLLITVGSSLGFMTILIPELQKENSEVSVTLNELTWISSIQFLLNPIGGIFSGPLSYYLGRRKMMMLSLFPYIVSWIILYYSASSADILLSFTITGLISGILHAPILTFVAEVTQPHLRGMFSATAATATIFGIFTQMLSGSLISWRTLALVNLTYPIVTLVALFWVPESPQWLASKGRFKDAEASLCWLRGWVTPDHVKEEYSQLCASNQSLAQATNLVKSTRRKLLDYCKPFLQKTFYVPFFIVMVAFAASLVGGCGVLETYAVIIFARLKSPLKEYTATAFQGIGQVVGTVICSCLIHFTGRRKIAFFSLFTTVLGFLVVSIYGFLSDHDIISSELYNWIPTASVLAVTFFMHVGSRMLPWILLGEVFPLNIRATSAGICASLSYIFASVMNKSFLYMVESITLAGTFLFFAMVNLIGMIVLFFTLPETEGRTLHEIEEHFSGINDLCNKPKESALKDKQKYVSENEMFC